MNNPEAKSAILESIRQNLAASLPFNAGHHAHHGHLDSVFSAPELNEFASEILIENFRKNLESVGGNCSVVYDEFEATEVLLAIISEKNAKKVAFSDSSIVKKIVGFLKMDTEFVENATADVLFETDLGITGAQMAIAETGTLVLESDSERNRLTSLVPPIHVCILEAKNIRQTLGETLEILQKDLSRTVTFITGASRTSDIELTLAIGVHGPGELHVILIDNEEISSTDEHR
jgi:L-lactate dehydrogenase complex protein LldG